MHPCIHVNTGWAFSQIAPGQPATPLSAVNWENVSTWKEALVNDFEAPVFAAYPVIGGIKEKMYRHGAVFAAMSGSGSAVVGIFPKNGIPDMRWEEHYRVFRL